MRKLLLMVALQLIAYSAYTQNISREKVELIFSTWMKTKGTPTSVTKQLQQISPKWLLKSAKPVIDEYTRTYTWTASTKSGETDYIVLTVEEDDESFKYGVKYLYWEYPMFILMQEELKRIYQGKFTEATEPNTKSKAYSLMIDGGKVNKPGTLDRFLFADNIDVSSTRTIRGFKFEITSRYINK